MGRRRQTVARKRVLKAAANKNVAFVLESTTDLQQELLENLGLRKGNNTEGEKSIDSPSERSNAVDGQSIDLPSLPSNTQVVRINYENFSDAEDIDMVESSPQVARTYSRKKSIEELVQEWETIPFPTDNNTVDNSIKIVHVESLYEQSNQTCPSEVVIMNAESTCSCGKSDDIEKYKMQVESLQRERDALLLKNERLETQNAKLLDSLTSKLLPTPEKPFKEEEGFIDCDSLIKMSHEAGNKDYLFLKFLMIKLFPEGFVGRSVTGRTSNNPSGRPRKREGECQDDAPQDENSPNNAIGKETVKIPLDSDAYMIAAYSFEMIPRPPICITEPQDA